MMLVRFMMIFKVIQWKNLFKKSKWWN